MQLVRQVSFDVHTYGAHDGLPAYPGGAAVQVPSAVAPPATVHTSQRPLQALEQQTPLTQNVEAQVLPDAHA